MDRPAKRRRVAAASIPYQPGTFALPKWRNNDQTLAKKLGAILKQSVDKAPPDQEVANEVYQMLQPRAQHSWKGWGYRGSWNYWTGTPGNRSGWNSFVCQGRRFEDPGNDWNDAFYAKGTAATQPIQQVNFFWTRNFANSIDPMQWRGNPVLTNPAAVETALAEGKGLPGNLVVTAVLEIAVALAAVEPARGPAVCMWWRIFFKERGKPVRQKAKLYQLSSTEGPCPQTSTQVVPDFFRKAFMAEGNKGSPTTVIGSWASALQVPVSKLMEVTTVPSQPFSSWKNLARSCPATPPFKATEKQAL